MTARIAGVIIPDKKHIVIGLTHIYGIGRSLARKVCEEARVTASTKVKDLNEAQLDTIRGEIGKHIVEGDLRRVVSTNIKRLVDLGTYRGRRHKMGLPVNGQRTKTNAKTRKGKKKSK